MHSAQAVLITAIVFSTALVQSIIVQSSLFSTCPHATLLRRGSMTRLWQQFEMNCTGNRCDKDLTRNSAISSTNAFATMHHHIYYQCIPVDEIEGRRQSLISSPWWPVVLRTNDKTYEPGSFAVTDPSVWNSLPLAARNFDLTLPAFHKLLNPELFRRDYTAP